VRQQRATVDVTDRVQPLGSADAHLVVHGQEAPGPSPDGLEPQIVGDGTASHRDEQLVGHQAFSVWARGNVGADALGGDGERPYNIAPLDQGGFTSSLAKGSSRTGIRPESSTIVTFEPRTTRLYQLHPTTPPPRAMRHSAPLAVVASFVHAAASAGPGITNNTAPVQPPRSRLVGDEHRVADLTAVHRRVGPAAHGVVALVEPGERRVVQP
jgi:hypothetical protein